MSLIPKSILPLESMYEFKELFAKYWVKLLKPSLIQSMFGDMVVLMLLLSVFNRYMRPPMQGVSIMISACFFMWVGFLIVHIVYRVLFGENPQDYYDKDE